MIPRDIRLLEELTINALPALQTNVYDGWILRFAGGYTRRANSVNALYAGDLPPEAKIEGCETSYARNGLPTIFKLTSTPAHQQIDALLEARGYAHESGASVQIHDLTGMPTPPGQAVFQTTISAEWLAAFFRLNQVAAENQTLLAQMLRMIQPALCQAAIYDGETAAAVALGVLQDGHLGIYDVVTDPLRRGRGFARALMLHLLHWGKAQGAHTAYLQVVEENTPAINLYAGLGFKPRYTYWYRARR
ncbi:MAG: GNAT family N-acetyltransferase [Anaerolineae bacterium]|nr:GNAT family N-acetyltransferase [Anaerolineae bacterium]